MADLDFVSYLLVLNHPERQNELERHSEQGHKVEPDRDVDDTEEPINSVQGKLDPFAFAEAPS